jgi:segregation and condensation protein B
MSEQVTPITQSEDVPGDEINPPAIDENSVALVAAEDNAMSAATEMAEIEISTIPEPMLKNILEAALLTSAEPIALDELKKLFDVSPGRGVIEKLLQQLAEDYTPRGIELTQVASGWRFRARPEMQMYLNRLNPQKQPRYSRAVMETLAIIAYRQPVTRGDIEDIRGVTVASPILKTLEARNWIEVIGTRDVPGKPELFATTQQLLDDLNLLSLHELPELEEIGNLLEQSAPESAELDAEKS